MPSEHDRAHAAKAAEQRQQRCDVRTGESAAHLCRFFIRHRLDEELQHARASQPCELQHAAAYYYWESHVNVPNATNTGWQGPEGDARGGRVCGKGAGNFGSCASRRGAGGMAAAKQCATTEAQIAKMMAACTALQSR